MNEGRRFLIVCAGKYGSTMETGRWILERLGPDAGLVVRAQEMTDPSDYEVVIMGSGIYSHKVLPELNEYARKWHDALKGKRLAVFGVAMDTTGVFVSGRVHGGWDYIVPFMEDLPETPVHAALLGGEINPHKLDEKDREGLKRFYKMTRGSSEIPFRTLMKKEDAWKFAEKLMDKLDTETQRRPL